MTAISSRSEACKNAYISYHVHGIATAWKLNNFTVENQLIILASYK